jgi:hypothetical protein
VRPAWVVIATFGVLAALAGVEHGIGEILWGSVSPPGLAFPSWPDTPSFAILDGEPAMTLMPYLLVSGIVTVATALHSACGPWPAPGAVTRAVLIALPLVLLSSCSSAAGSHLRWSA